MLYFRMTLTMLVSLYTSRVVLNTLGIEDFGIYNVVGGVVVMFGFFNSAMSSATQRFLSFEIGRNNLIQLRSTFNAALIVHISIAILVVILAETIGLWFVNRYLNIAAERMEAARWVYQFSILSFVISIIQVPYNAAIIAHERMNIYAYVSILEVTLRLLVVLMLTWISFDKLKLYAILICVVTLVIAIIYCLYSLRHFNETKFVFVRDKKLYKTLVSYSGWNLFGNIAGVAKGQGINILFNIFFGAIVNAAQGIAYQVQAATQSFVNNFQMAMNPQIIKSYASRENEYLNQLIIRGSKFSFYLLLIISIPIIVEVDFILELWLNTVPKYASTFTVLILIISLIDCISGPLMTAIQATGNIKAYQAIVGTLLILILPISYIFFKFHFPPETALLINIIIATIALFIRLFFMNRYLNFSIILFLKEVVLRNLIIGIFTFTPVLLAHKIIEVVYIRLPIVLALTIIVGSVVIYLIGLNGMERECIKTHLTKFIYRKNG